MENSSRTDKRDLYYTKDYEWIDFQGSVAYMGVCQFKLSGFKEVHQFEFLTTEGYYEKGDVIAVIRYTDYSIEAHMPVDGRIIQLNQALQEGDGHLLLQHAEDSGWIALMIPSRPDQKNELLLPKQYQMKIAGKYGA